MTLSNTLADLAEQVKLINAEAVAAEATAIAKALETGRLLVEAKTACAHGEWLPFLDRSGVGERKAQRLMQLARSGLKSDTVTALGGIKAALDFLSARVLPDPANYLVAYRSGTSWPSPLTVIWESSAHPGYFYLYQFPASDDECSARWLTKPVKGEAVWSLVDHFYAGKLAGLDFQRVPKTDARIADLVKEDAGALA